MPFGFGKLAALTRRGFMSTEVNARHVLETQRSIPGSFLEESAAVWCVLLKAT
jgi:predicted ATPase